MTSASARRQHVRRADSDAALWTGWRRTGCATHSSTPPRSARPTRAALLTGRNHHTGADRRHHGERAPASPATTRMMPEERGTFAEVLKQNGYNTAWYGKNHNVPDWQTSHAGPFDLLADRAGLRILLRLHRRRHESVASRRCREHQADRAAARRRRTTTSTRTWPTTPSRASGMQHAVAPDKPCFAYYAPRHRPRPAPRRRRSGSRSSRASSTRAGTSMREETLRAAEGARHRSRRTPSSPRAPRTSRRGTRSTPTRRRSSPT